MTEAGPSSNKDEVVHQPADRLESWKEIAAYLKRGVRTVQRWERTEGLPVHRHHHDKRGTIYAFRHEIDAWLDQRGGGTASATARGSQPAADGHNPAVASVAAWMEAVFRRFVPTRPGKKGLSGRQIAWIVLILL